MNLQACYNTPGTWITMRGIPTEYVLQRTNQFGPWAKGKICDDNGQVAEITFSGSKKAALPPQSLLNIPCLWGVKFDANSGSLKALFNSFAQQGASIPQGQTPMAPYPSLPMGPAGPEPPRQMPQMAPQATNTPPPGVDATGTSIERQVAVKAVTEIMVKKLDTGGDYRTLVQDAACWLEFFANFMATGSTETQAPIGPADWTPNDQSDLPPELRDDYQG